jgi:hypothetical protein
MCLTNVFIFQSLDRIESFEDEVIFPSDDVSTVLSSVKKLLQYDMRRRQATAIVLMGVIGAEFQGEVEVYEKRNGGDVKAKARKGSESSGKCCSVSFVAVVILVTVG